MKNTPRFKKRKILTGSDVRAILVILNCWFLNLKKYDFFYYRHMNKIHLMIERCSDIENLQKKFLNGRFKNSKMRNYKFFDFFTHFKDFGLLCLISVHESIKNKLWIRFLVRLRFLKIFQDLKRYLSTK